MNFEVKKKMYPTLRYARVFHSFVRSLQCDIFRVENNWNHRTWCRCVKIAFEINFVTVNCVVMATIAPSICVCHFLILSHQWWWFLHFDTWLCRLLLHMILHRETNKSAHNIRIDRTFYRQTNSVKSISYFIWNEQNCFVAKPEHIA